MRDEPVVVARFYYRHQADFARLSLEAADIPSMVLADDAGGVEVALSFVNSVRLVVREQDAEEARRILREVEETDPSEHTFPEEELEPEEP